MSNTPSSSSPIETTSSIPDPEVQRHRFLAAVRLGQQVRWFKPKPNTEAMSSIEPDAAICQMDNAERDLYPVTLETITRYLVLETAAGDERTCLAYPYHSLAAVVDHVRHCATADAMGDGIIAIFDLDVERQVVFQTAVSVEVTFPADRPFAYYDPKPVGPRVIGRFVPDQDTTAESRAAEDALEWDATAQIRRLDRTVALGLRDGTADVACLVPLEIVEDHDGPFRVEIEAEIKRYYIALDQQGAA